MTGRYFYQRKGFGWQIYHTVLQDGAITFSEPIEGGYCQTHTEAKKRVYELNGWNGK